VNGQPSRYPPGILRSAVAPRTRAAVTRLDPHTCCEQNVITRLKTQFSHAAALRLRLSNSLSTLVCPAPTAHVLTTADIPIRGWKIVHSLEEQVRRGAPSAVVFMLGSTIGFPASLSGAVAIRAA